MARSLKDIKRRIASVKKTRQITRAMKLVAGAKLKRATDAAVSARPYQQHLSAVLGRVAASAGDQVDSALLKPREHVARIGLVLLTSDRGLCGGFNNTLVRRTADWIAERKAAGAEVSLWIYGRKGQAGAAARRWQADKVVVEWTGAKGRRERVDALCADAIAAFEAGHLDEVVIGYNAFVNVLTQKPAFRRLLPATVDGTTDSVDYLAEPNAPAIVEALLPLYVRTIALQTFLETEAGEHAARMTAMDSATRNAGELIQGLTLEYNRARQAAITKELIEIVSGAQAL